MVRLFSLISIPQCCVIDHSGMVRPLCHVAGRLLLEWVFGISLSFIHSLICVAGGRDLPGPLKDWTRASIKLEYRRGLGCKDKFAMGTA